MSRKPVREWMILLTYFFLLIIITIHSGYLCRKLWFIGKQFFPIVCAAFLALMLNRPYKYVQRFYEKRIGLPKKATRIGSLLTVYLGMIGVVAAVLRFALPRFVAGLRQFIENRENYMSVFEYSVLNLFDKMGISNLDMSPLLEGLSGYLGKLDQVMGNVLPRMAQMTTGVFRTAALLGIVLVLSVYILYDKDNLKIQMSRFYRAYMPEKLYEPAKQVILTGVKVFDNFAAGQSLESLILGSLCFIGMIFLRLEYSGIVSLVVGLTAFIPYLGAYIGGGLGTLLLLFVSVRKAVTFLVFFIVLQQVENNLIYPKVVGKRTGLPSLWVLTAVSVGGGLFGIAGMILAVPTATLIYILLKNSIEKRELKRGRQEKENRV